MYTTLLLTLVAVVRSSPTRDTLQQLLNKTASTGYDDTTNSGRRLYHNPCPYGTYYDQTYQGCKMIINSPFNSTTRPKTVSTATEEILPTTAKTFPITAERLPMYVDLLPNNCPVDPRLELLHPHETQCTMYYECRYGQKLLKFCPPGWHFSYPSQVCLHASENDCTVLKERNRNNTTTTEIPQRTTATLQDILMIAETNKVYQASSLPELEQPVTSTTTTTTTTPAYIDNYGDYEYYNYYDD